MQQALESAMAELCLGRSVPSNPGGIRAWLESHHVAPDDIEFLLETGIERLSVYRRLVRNNLYAALQVSMPRTVARLGDAFDDAFGRFLDGHGPRTHYLRDVVEEFLASVEPEWSRGRGVPRYVWDLARHEALRIQMGAMQPRPPNTVIAELDLDRGVKFIEAVGVVRYQYAVHELSEREDDRTEPAKRDVALLVYRSPQHEVRFLELTPMAAELLDALMHQQLTLRDGLVRAAQRSGHELDEAVLGGAAQLLADLAERGVLLGLTQDEPVQNAGPALR